MHSVAMCMCLGGLTYTVYSYTIEYIHAGMNFFLNEHILGTEQNVFEITNSS